MKVNKSNRFLINSQSTDKDIVGINKNKTVEIMILRISITFANCQL